MECKYRNCKNKVTEGRSDELELAKVLPVLLKIMKYKLIANTIKRSTLFIFLLIIL